MAFAGVNSLTVANVIMAHSATEKEAAMQSTRFVIAHSAAVETGVPKSLNPPAYVSSVTPIPPGVIARAVASTTSGMAAARCHNSIFALTAVAVCPAINTTTPNRSGAWIAS